MNKQELDDAKAQLEASIEDWAIEYSGLVTFPDILAEDAAEYIFTVLLGTAENSDE